MLRGPGERGWVRVNRQRRGRLPAVGLVLGAALLAACTSTSASDPPTPSPPGTPPATTASAEPTVDPALAADIEDWRGKRDTRTQIRSIIASVDGQIVFEEYYGTTPDVARDMESVTKSVMSALVGAAIARGDLRSVDQTLAELLPSYASTMPPAGASVSLRQLLTMTAGVPDWDDLSGREVMSSPDWVAAILASIAPAADGEFTYSNGSAHLVSAVLAQATGRSVLDFAREVLFDPLGIDASSAIEPLAVPSNFEDYKAATFAWPVDPQEVNLGWSLLTLRPRDMLKIGELHLNGGEWDGKQLLPATWVADATTAQVKTYDTLVDYGYLWWVTTADQEAAYAAIGAGGQLIEVVPSRGLVVAVASEYDAISPADLVEDPFDLKLMVDDLIAPAVAR